MTFFSDGTSSDSRVEPARLGIKCVRSEILDRGSLRGRFVSAPMMRCAASRWLIALRTWGALNEGFSGTCELLAAGTHASSRLVTHQYRSQFEQRVRELSLVSNYASPMCFQHTVANSALFPRLTATLSPFFTPSFCSPLASLFESRSSASYVRRIR